MKFRKKQIKNIITGIFAVFLLFWLFQIDWDNLYSKTNSGAFFGVLSGALFIISMQIKDKEPKA